MEPWLLDTQYRMHPAIAEFPNLLFYDGKLKSGITAADRPAPRGKPPAASVFSSSNPAGHDKTLRRREDRRPGPPLPSRVAAVHCAPDALVSAVTGRCSLHLSTGVSAGFPWPKTDKPVALVECDHGTELRAGAMRGGKISVTQSIAPGASSYCNAEEAGLAIRSATCRTLQLSFATPANLEFYQTCSVHAMGPCALLVKQWASCKWTPACLLAAQAPALVACQCSGLLRHAGPLRC